MVSICRLSYRTFKLIHIILPATPPADQFLVKNILKIIDLCTKDAINNRPKSQAELTLEVECQKLEAQLLADAKRRKLLEQDLTREREWAKRLEKCVRNLGASYPVYPGYDI